MFYVRFFWWNYMLINIIISMVRSFLFKSLIIMNAWWRIRIGRRWNKTLFRIGVCLLWIWNITLVRIKTLIWIESLILVKTLILIWVLVRVKIVRILISMNKALILKLFCYFSLHLWKILLFWLNHFRNFIKIFCKFMAYRINLL